MNRKLRRAKPSSKKKYSLEDVQKAMNIALTIRSLSKGHLFSKTMKDKCIFCGAGMETRKMCQYWFLSFLDRMQIVLINPNFFTDQEIEALWLRNEDEYKNVKIPLSNEKT